MISSYFTSFSEFGSSLLAVLAFQQVVHDLLLDANLAVFRPLNETCSPLENVDSPQVDGPADLLLLKLLFERRSLLVVNLDWDSSCHSPPDDGDSSSVDTFGDLVEFQLVLQLALPDVITTSADHNLAFPFSNSSLEAHF